MIPSQAAKWRPERKTVASGTLAERCDRPHAGDGRQQPAAGIGFVMDHQFGLKRLQPHLKGGDLAGQTLSNSRRRHIRIFANPFEQFCEVLRPLGRDHSELRRMAGSRWSALCAAS